MFFEGLGLLESYHPRKQLRMQLARIMALNLLNLYALIIALFDKIGAMNKTLICLKKNITMSRDLSESLMYNVGGGGGGGGGGDGGTGYRTSINSNVSDDDSFTTTEPILDVLWTTVAQGLYNATLENIPKNITQQCYRIAVNCTKDNNGLLASVAFNKTAFIQSLLLLNLTTTTTIPPGNLLLSSPTNVFSMPDGTFIDTTAFNVSSDFNATDDDYMDTMELLNSTSFKGLADSWYSNYTIDSNTTANETKSSIVKRETDDDYTYDEDDDDDFVYTEDQDEFKNKENNQNIFDVISDYGVKIDENSDYDEEVSTSTIKPFINSTATTPSMDWLNVTDEMYTTFASYLENVTADYVYENSTAYEEFLSTSLDDYLDQFVAEKESDKCFVTVCEDVEVDEVGRDGSTSERPMWDNSLFEENDEETVAPNNYTFEFGTASNVETITSSSDMFPTLDQSENSTTQFHKHETLTKFISHMDSAEQLALRKLCWETMFGQEMVKLTVMDLVSN